MLLEIILLFLLQRWPVHGRFQRIAQAENRLEFESGLIPELALIDPWDDDSNAADISPGSHHQVIAPARQVIGATGHQTIGKASFRYRNCRDFRRTFGASDDHSA